MEITEISQHYRFPSTEFFALESACRWCASWLRFVRACSPSSKLAAVFDIDATLVLQGGRIESVCDLFDLCGALGITVFLITARSDRGEDFTTEQMGTLGLAAYKKLFMHPAGKRCNAPEAGERKLQWRQKIEAHGYSICFNAGDAFHDHFSPLPRALIAAWGHERIYVFITPDGTGHLKLPG